MAVLELIVHPPRWMRLTALLAFLAVAANLFWHGAQPYAVGAVPPPWDKVAHLMLYGGFCGAAWVALGGTRPVADLLAPMAAMSIGVLDEFAQSFNPGRAVGLDDLAADATGALVAVLLLAVLRDRVGGARPRRTALRRR